MFVKRILQLAAAFAITTVMAVPAFALPTFQTYIEGGSPGSYGPDEHTWFHYGPDPFTLLVVGAYGPNTYSLTGVTLLISVPEGETGTISFNTSDEAPVLLTMTGQGTGSPDTNPTRDADTAILTDVVGSSGYDDINDPSFVPAGFNLNNHYPLHDDVSDFLIYSLGDFDDEEGPLNDYNADGGTITPTSATGEVKEYTVSFTGFTSLHIDAYGLETDILGREKIQSTWEVSPGSHDSTALPEPGTLTLLALGSSLLAVRMALGRKSRQRA